MELLNLHFEVILFFALIVCSVGFFCYKNSQKKKNKLWEILLFLSCFIFAFSIFDIRVHFFQAKQEVEQAKIMFVLDVSKSMLTQDIVDKNTLESRLTISKEIVKNTLKAYPENQYSLWAFAWEYVQILPFTSDKNIFLNFLSWLNKDNVSVQWTNFTSIFSSLENTLSDEHKYSSLVILTDAENLSEEKIEKLNQISQLELDVLIVWVWTKKWGFIPVWTDMFWMPLYKIYNWKRVVSSVDHDKNKQFSINNNFNYLAFESIDDMNKYNKILSKGLKKSQVYLSWNSSKSLTVYFVFISFLLFLGFLIFDQKLWKK